MDLWFSRGGQLTPLTPPGYGPANLSIPKPIAITHAEVFRWKFAHWEHKNINHFGHLTGLVLFYYMIKRRERGKNSQ